MSTGRVATVQLAATTLTTVYQVPTGYYGVYNVSCTNTTSSAVTIRLAVSTSGGATPTPSASEYYEYGTTIVPNGVFERTGIVIGAGLYILAYASAGTAGLGTAVNVNIYGIETSTQ
jgi:hypothetical protein